MQSFEKQNLIVPFDFSKPARAALEQVIEWSKSSTTIHLLYVVEPTWTFVAMDPAVQLPPNFDIETREQSSQKLAELVGKLKQAHVTPHCVIGDPGSEIVKLAEKVEATMIVMPSHGRTGISRFLLGSVAERVLRLARCPVLILKGKQFQPAQ